MALVGAYVGGIKFLGLLMIAISLFIISEVDGMTLGEEISHSNTQQRSRPLTIKDVVARSGVPCHRLSCRWGYLCGSTPNSGCECYTTPQGTKKCRDKTTG
uniref:Putative secreted protein n=1 Tax=Ixodes ricinus TaxID=34613 RepID=A0A6B0UG53_IXORI